jgi:hypothetical protein
MRKQIIEQAAFEVATQVRAVEERIDSAFAELAELQSRIMRANAVARVGVGAVHETLEHVAAAVQGLVETRGSMVACHAALANAKGKVPGLRTVAWGDGQECPPEEGFATLRVVA